jgi:hypothetical protein
MIKVQKWLDEKYPENGKERKEIQKLDLSSLNLEGKLSFFGFTNLQEVNISDNPKLIVDENYRSLIKKEENGGINFMNNKNLGNNNGKNGKSTTATIKSVFCGCRRINLWGAEGEDVGVTCADTICSCFGQRTQTLEPISPPSNSNK